MRNPELNAKILVIQCRTGRKPVGLRFEERGRNDWWLTWSFAIPDTASGGTDLDDDHTIQGSLNSDPGFPACARCQAASFFQCGRCERASCWDGESDRVTCAWCDEANHLTETISQIQSRGDQ